MVPLWTPLALDVPIFYCSDDVTFIERTKHNLDFIESFRFGIAHQEVNSASYGLGVLACGYF